MNTPTATPRALAHDKFAATTLYKACKKLWKLQEREDELARQLEDLRAQIATAREERDAYAQSHPDEEAIRAEWSAVIQAELVDRKPAATPALTPVPTTAPGSSVSAPRNITRLVMPGRPARRWDCQCGTTNEAADSHCIHCVGFREVCEEKAVATA